MASSYCGYRLPKTAFLAGTVPYAIIGNWEWQDYCKAGFDMNLIASSWYQTWFAIDTFASVSGYEMLTVYAAKRQWIKAQRVLNNFFGSAAGTPWLYENVELRPPGFQEAAQKDASISAAQRGFSKAGAVAGIPKWGHPQRHLAPKALGSPQRSGQMSSMERIHKLQP
jgi:hypothetical protein